MPKLSTSVKYSCSRLVHCLDTRPTSVLPSCDLSWTSDNCVRQCCGPQRSFELFVEDYQGNEVLRISRPYKCVCCHQVCSCANCCFDEVSVESPPGCYIGRVVQAYGGCRPVYQIKDEADATVLVAEGPIYTKCYCPGDDIPFTNTCCPVEFCTLYLFCISKPEMTANKGGMFRVNVCSSKPKFKPKGTAFAQLAWDTFSPAQQTYPTATVTIDENMAATTTVLTITTTGATGTVTYSIASSTTAAFTIGASTGVITVNDASLLDREAISFIDLVLQAVDTSPATVSTTVRIDLKDVNEIAPTFSSTSTYSVTISESATVGTTIQALTVTDTDSAATNVACTISSGDPDGKFQFRSDNQTIELKAAIEPDSPTNNSLTYTLTIVCYDNFNGVYSGGSLASTGTVSVSVTPVNDNSPTWGTFTPALATPITTIDENLASGTIFTAAASDVDYGTDGVVTFSFSTVKFNTGADASALFTIGSSSGVVSRTAATTPALDRETYSHVEFVVLAMDSPTVTADRLTITQTVQVNLKDVNEFTPVFDPSTGLYNVSFSETAPAGTLVLNVSVSDPDFSRTAISCTITSGNTLDRFQMRADGTSLELKTQIEPDSPTSDPINYVLTLSCADNTAGTYSGGQKSSTGTVTVWVEYNNDYSPVWSTFSPAWTSATTPISTILENLAVNQTVFTASATDDDAGDDGLVVYSISGAVAENGSSVMEAFAINGSSGAVSIANSTVLDREGYSYVDVTVEARDSPASGTTYTITQTVRIGISDYNEFPPAFTPSTGLYTPAIPETTTAGTAVQTIVATDPDYSNTAVVCAIAAGNSLNRFAINTADKKLVETASVIQPDKPTLDPTIYLLTVHCADMNNGTLGTPVLTSTAYITVNVTLVNDYDPTITLNSTTMVIPEDTPVSSFIVSVTADDLDYGNDGTFTISLSPTTPFALTGDRTKLLLTEALDRETKDSYVIEMRALDQGSPARSSTTTLTVSITDVNDNTPVCSPNTYNVSVTADSAATLVASIPCTDADLGDNQLLAYSFLSGDTRNLTLSSTTGALTTTFLTYDSAAPSKTLVITVRDSATPASAQRTATVTVTVHVLPRNLGPPVWGTFNPPWISATTAINSVSENADEGFAVFTAVAIDYDSGPDGQVIYSLASVTGTDGTTSVDLSSVFNISSSSGQVQVKTKGILDREATPAYTYINFVVQARDNPTTGTPNSIIQTVRVDVTDFNELDPTFTGDPFSATLVEVATILACSAQTPPNSTIIELNTAIDPDRPKNHPLSYLLIVTCLDNNGAGSYRTATANLSVTITTTNDHTPVVSIPIGSSITLPETQAIGDVADISVVDQDYGTDGTVACSIAPTGTFGLTGCTKLTLVSGLDYPTASSYSLTITAVDSGATPRTGSVVVTVTVTDVNRYTPSCSPATYSASVLETAASFPTALTPATTITCTDGDGNGVYYQLVDSSVPFSVNNLTGVLSLNGPVDYDSAVQTYTILIRAVDPADSSKSGLATATVAVTAANEFTPTFPTATVTLSVYETVASSTTITTFAATDADYSPHAITSYAIASGNTGGMFAISNAGVITVASGMTIDYEAVSGSSPYVLQIVATDGGGLTGTGTISIVILDSNDLPPVFSPANYSASVPEGSAAGTTVTTVTATDGDTALNNNNKILYSKLTGDSAGYFSVNSTNGLILTTGNILNYDTVTQVVFTVTAVDGNGAGPHTATTTVTVAVTDVNLHAPSCSPSTVTVNNIREDVTVGTALTSLTSPVVICTDGDAKDTLTYTMSASASDSHFAVNPTSGAITVSTALDFETARIHQFEVVVTDSATPAKSVSMAVTINVLDVNEFSPTCTVPTTASMNEAQAVGTAAYSATSCSDSDGTATTLQFALVPGTPFQVSSSGAVTASSALDYDPASATTSYSVRLIVSDNAPTISSLRSSTYTTVVSVTPVNEFAPVLTYTALTASLAEDSGTGTALALKTIGGTSVSMAATDADRGLNHATLTWSIVGGNDAGKFSINSASGALQTAAALDRETAASYTLLVSVTDGGGLSSTANCTVAVSVTDINDNTPVCNPASQTITLYEGEAAKQLVDFGASGRVTDADSGVNAQLTFSLNNAVANSAVTVSESSSVGTQVFQFVPNLGTGGTGPLTMSLVDFSPSANSNLFAFDASTGRVSVNQALDYDSSSTRGPFVLMVKVTDATPLTASGTLTISLTDVNDNDPQFGSTVEFTKTIDENRTTQRSFFITIADQNDNTPAFASASFAASVAEESAPSTTVGTYAATDADAGVNAQLTYSLTSQDGISDASKFTVSSAGAVTTAATLDREQFGVYRLLLLAKDGGSPPRTGTTTLVITVNDINEHTPLFSGLPDTVKLVENSTAGTLVYTIAATDRDSTYGALTYSIIDGNNSTAFAIDASTGQVTVASPVTLNREAIPVYQLVVQVQDNGSPAKSATSTLTVSVMDVNEFAPSFASPTVSFSIAENSPVGSTLGTVTATDSDGPSQTVSYAVAATLVGTAGHFSVNSVTGVVYVNQAALDRETLATYVLQIAAYDNGVPSLTSSPLLNVTISITDTNDNDPVFSAAYYNASVSESLAIGSVVLTVSATDQDAGSNAALTYSLHSSATTASTFFSINSATGQLSTIAALDYETNTDFLFTVMVKDAGTSPQRSSTASVWVSLNNVNEHRPVFASTFYNCEVPYNDDTRAILATLTATDADAGTFGTITSYSWNSTNIYLYLGATSGQVIRNSDQVMERNKKYIQYAMATDGGGLVSTQNATVRCDSFPPEDYVDVHPGSSVRFWKKQKSGIYWVGYFYALSSLSTDSISNIGQDKEFLTKSQLLDKWRLKSDGTPTSVLTSSSFSNYRVNKVEPYPDSDSDASTNWLDTWWGKLCLALGAAAGVALIGALVYGLVNACGGAGAGASAAAPTAAAAGQTTVAPAAGVGGGKATSQLARQPMNQRHLLPNSQQQPKPPQRFQDTPRPDFNDKQQQQQQQQQKQNNSNNRQNQNQSRQSNNDSGRGSAASDVVIFEL
uniref:Cadherin domain-containing protein n=1 Tax=Macrostomum lignano TaxID=282301 RepID=A0A1I8GS27_9PLAT